MNRSILLPALLLAATAAQAQRALPSVHDAYGYRVYDSAGAQCPASYVDTSGGTALALSASSGSASAADDGGAQVTLAAPFQFYGQPVTSIVASSNGYLAPGADFSQEDGGDFSNDCPLPAIADNPVATMARIYVYHDELAGTSGTLNNQYFATCPRASDSGIAEACTVFTWSGWTRTGSGGALNAQAVLYHGTHEIALQYAGFDASAGAGATIGLQSTNATSGMAYGCNGQRTLAAPLAVCWFDPRYPPGSQGVVDTLFANGFE